MFVLGGQTLFKNGFTLIELLAVLVILAIIALIAIPQILSLIDNAKEKSTKVSAKNYLRAVELAVMNKDTDIEVKKLNGTYEIKDNGKKIVSEDNTIDIEFDGQGLKEGYLTITNYKVTALDTKIDKYSIRLVDGEIDISTQKEVEKSILVTGQEFNSKIKTLVNEPNTSYKFTDEKVKSIDFYSNGLLPSGHTKETLELLPKASVSINNDAIAYNDNGKIYIISDKLISFNKDSSYMFHSLKKTFKIEFRNIDTSDVTDMKEMFYDCNELLVLNLNKFKTTKVTKMNHMFSNCSKLKTLDLSSFDTSKVTDMYGMFYGCKSLSSLNLSKFNTSNVTDMRSMFCGCRGLTNLDVSNFDTTKVTSMEKMFFHCESLTNLNLSSFNTLNVTNMFQLFEGCRSLTIINLNNFDTGNVINMESVFNSCSSLEEIIIGCNWKNAQNITNMFNFSKYTLEQFNSLIEQKQANCSTLN